MRIVRSLSATTFLLAATLLPLATAHCTYQTSQTSTGGAADGGSLNLAGLNVSLLPLQPASDWTANAGTINPACTPPNPQETGFTDLSSLSGVDFSTASNQAQCCTCAARSRVFPVTTTPIAGTRLVGELLMTSGANDTYAMASLRVTFKLAGSVVAKQLFQPGQGDNNCAGSSELPATIANGIIDVEIGSFANSGATQFDEVDVDINGYGCETASTDEKLYSLGIATPAADAGPSPAPDAGPAATGTGTTAPPSPATVGFQPVLCGGATNLADLRSGTCPNGVNLGTTTTVTCIIEPCATPTSCITAPGKLTVSGNTVIADCSGLTSECPMNYQMTINDRIVCR